MHPTGGVAMTEHAVVIAGGGPTGMMLAGELALAGIDVVIVERRASQELDGSRAGGLHSRTIEVLDQRGIAERFLAEGRWHQVQRFAGIRLDISDFPTRHNYGLALWQSHFERILAAWVGELGVPILRGREVTGFAQDDTGVDVELSDGASLRAEYLVGCDGGRSVIRKAAGIDFPGLGPVDQLSDRRGRDGRGAGVRHAPRGRRHPCRQQAEDGGPSGSSLTERDVEHASEPTLQDLSEALIAAVRDGLRGAQPDLDLPFHRHDPAGGVLPQAAGCCWRATPPTCIPRRAARASTPACRMR